MCLSPICVPVRVSDENGKIVAKEFITVRCGHCVECESQRASEWSHRIMDELSLHKEAFFLTLTYNDDLIPIDHNLCKRDVQLFIKRLRKHISPTKIRYFMCGEYGSKNERPHYHLLIFGWKPDDLSLCPWQDRKSKNILYVSPLIDRLWSIKHRRKEIYHSLGFHSILVKIDLEVARYCSKYMQKFNSGVDREVKPYVAMSTNPGIGHGAIDLNSLDSDRIYHRGKSCPLPRYYLKVMEKEWGVDTSKVKLDRLTLAELKDMGFVVSPGIRKKLQQQADFLNRRS